MSKARYPITEYPSPLYRFPRQWKQGMSMGKQGGRGKERERGLLLALFAPIPENSHLHRLLFDDG